MSAEDFIGDLKFKIKDGTTNSGTDLCCTCTKAFIRRGARGSSEDGKWCNYGRDLIPVYGAVAECSGFFPKGVPDFWELKEIAWRIDSDKKSGKVGFISPKEWKNRGDE